MLKGFLDKKDETKKELEELVKTEKDDDDRKEYQEKLNKAQTGEQIMRGAGKLSFAEAYNGYRNGEKLATDRLEIQDHQKRCRKVGFRRR